MKNLLKIGFVGLSLLFFSCDKEEQKANLQFVKTELGGCNLKSEQNNNDAQTQNDTVIVTISEDSVHFFVGLNYICKELPFETQCEMIDGILTMNIIDSGGEYLRCTCYYTFDFIFSYNKDVNQKYKILLIDPREENPITVEEGNIQIKY
jgi:hypothetical protein